MCRGVGPGSIGVGWTRVYRGGVVLCLDSLCRWQVQVSVYCAWWIPAHLRCTQCSNPVAPYGYLLPNMYLFRADIANPDSFVRSCRNWISEEQRQPSSVSTWPACQKKR